ncbi:MAG TPA: phage portal protein [Acidimicrobiales bacterium]
MGRRERRQIARAEAQILELIAEVQQRRLSGDGMQPDELPIVVACRRLYADTILQLPLIVTRHRLPIDQQPPVVTRPDPFEPRWLTMQRVVDNLTGPGRCWIVPTAWAADGWPTAVRVHDASQGAPIFDPFTGELVEVSINTQRLRPGPDGVIWLPYEVPARGHPGQGPLTRCWRAVEYLCALFDMAGSFWEAGFPSLAVQVLQRLSPDDTKKLKGQLLGAWSRRHEPAVLDNGAQIATVGTSAVESQLVESIAAANAEVTRAFGVMPSLVNVAGGDSLTYSTTEGEFTKWKSIGLGPYLTRLEGAWSDLLPFGQSARFDTGELTRADWEKLVAGLAVATGGEPWMTVDEARDRIGLAPLQGELPPPRSLPAPSPLAGDPELVGGRP